jgi:hypothetical protein
VNADDMEPEAAPRIEDAHEPALLADIVEDSSLVEVHIHSSPGTHSAPVVPYPHRRGTLVDLGLDRTSMEVALHKGDEAVGHADTGAGVLRIHHSHLEGGDEHLGRWLHDGSLRQLAL